MPGQFLRLRLLRSAGSLGFISDAYRVRASGCCSYRTISGLSTVRKSFPFHLKASCLPARICFDSNVPAVISRQFSGVSRDRGGRSGSFSSGRTGNFGRGRELASGGLYEAARKGKSLIEDEAELSDWVSDLRTDRFPKLSDSDSGDEMTFSSGRKTRGEAPGARNQRKERDLGRGKRRDSSSGLRDVDWEGEATGFRGSGSRRNNVSDEEIVGFRKRKASGFSMSGAPRTNLDSQEDFGDFRKRKETSFRGRKITGMNIDSDEEIGDFRTKKTPSFRWENTPTTVSQSHETGRFGGRDSGRLVKKKFEHQKPVMKIVEEEDEEDEDDDEDSGFESDFLSGSDGEEQSGNYMGNDKVSGKPKEKAGELPKRSSQGKDSYLSESRFEDATLSPLSIKGVKAAGYEKMTVVQEATLPVILRGKDVLAKAKTGTGKTVAFLLPAIEAIVKLPPVGRDEKRPPIYVLIVCPTRELANQAAAEATKLLKFHPAIGVQFVIGGTRLPLEQKRMQANPCQILVATPGRLRDHIENTPGFATRLLGVKMLVLDEADHLLDMGFRKDIEKIIEAVPKQRQTLLFSATVPDEVRQMCHIALRRDHEFINTVEEGTQETHSQVKQMHLVAPLERHFSILYSLLKEHVADDPDYKVLVFCTTAMVTKLMSAFLSELNLNIREIHSRKPQSYRTRVSDEFRKSKGLILVTSDVSARGVDYPDVTLVVQVGLPSDREQYIHRLGRTGRKGKEGQGILLLAPWEDFFLSSIRDLPMSKAELPPTDPDMKKKVERALAHVEMKNKEAAYQAWLGYYNSVKTLSRDKVRLVELANEFSYSMGLDKPPAIPKLILGKMGLKNVPGLRSK